MRITLVTAVWRSLILIAFLAFSSGASTQSIVLDQSAVKTVLDDITERNRIIMVNGLNTTVLGPSQTELNQTIESSGLTKLLLSLLTHRLHAENLIALNTPLSSLVPEIIEANPFERAISIRHLLQETAGLATPPTTLPFGARTELIRPDQLAQFIIKQRSADQLSIHDPVGWAVLIHALETAAAKPFDQIVAQHFTGPLGLSPSDVTIQYTQLSGTKMPVSLTLNEQTATALVRLLVRNATDNGDLYLPRGIYNSWLNLDDGHRLHPYADVSTAGITASRFGSRTTFTSLNAPCSDTVAFAAFPREGSAFLIISSQREKICATQVAQTISQRVITELFPPTTANKSRASLAPPSTLSGRYIKADTAPAWLRERLDQMKFDWFTIDGHTETALNLNTAQGETRVYRSTTHYLYEAADPFYDSGSKLIFSPFKLGGYAIKDGSPYRRIDVLGLTSAFEYLLPWTLLLLASAGIYRFTMKDRAWRNMGVIITVGAVMVTLGLFLELTAWPYIVYEYDKAWLVILWRIGLNIGLMAVLTAPMFTVTFSRNNKIPQGLLEPLVKLHLILLSAAALALLLVLVAWGVAGTFAAY